MEFRDSGPILEGVTIVKQGHFLPILAYFSDLGVHVLYYNHVPINERSPNFLCNLSIPIGYPEAHIEDFDELKGVAVLQSMLRFGPIKAFLIDFGERLLEFLTVANNDPPLKQIQGPETPCGISYGYPKSPHQISKKSISIYQEMPPNVVTGRFLGFSLLENWDERTRFNN